MIPEVAVFNVIPEKRAEFEVGFRSTKEIIYSIKGLNKL